MSLAIVGLGPGGPEHRTAAAERAIRQAEVVIGYAPYIDQCADLLHTDQEVIRGAMGEELERAREALDHASSGARVALVSSGDAGVHGMAARTLALAALKGGLTPINAGAGDLPAQSDLTPKGGLTPLISVVPGVTAALAVAARVGAPLGDDWATLSLSDLHVAWEVVERRLTALASSGIALALYNPRSRTRTEPFARALAILLAHRDPETPVVIATDVAREGETITRATLATVDPGAVTMRSLVLVAGETGAWAGDWLVAVRG
jgi:precorrin-3B C17-methyltransferase